MLADFIDALLGPPDFYFLDLLATEPIVQSFSVGSVTPFSYTALINFAHSCGLVSRGALFLPL